MRAILLLNFFLVVCLYAIGVLSGSCVENLASFQKVMKAREACIGTLHLNSTDVVEIKDLKEKQFRDKCLSNCTLEGVNYLKNGTILKDKILEQLKSEATTEVYDKLAKIVDECFEFANTKHQKKSKEEEKVPSSPMPHFNGTRRGFGCRCKKAAKFISCMAEKDQNLC